MTHPAPSSALATSHGAPAICKAPPKPQAFTRLGLHQNGCFYQYGDSYDKPAHLYEPDDALLFDRILDIQIAHRKREYLELDFLSEGLLCRLCLPCGGITSELTGTFSVQLPVRSLLGALLTLDLSAVSGMLSARLGTPSRTGTKPRWIDVFVNNILPGLSGPCHVREPMIGPTHDDLLIAVEDCRALLHHPPSLP